MSWSTNFRLHPRLGPFVANITKKGLRSISIKRSDWLTYNTKRKKLTINPPGPGSVSYTFDSKNKPKG